ncbi:DUF4054 domain-containing protein [Aggregatibacter actinomycetemcomitans]|uniref:DUF4054 domain-containing protein n=1 Tax=Aggregatibacter actinomycetemcomitans TaxID=714 RepID=UPI0011D34C8A|nr:DUF4054 domain-containing protein [Aggregatibacter actinomycetemcomitans]TYA25093.1 DUF4054 domain-containing protein [Aggregatibacter actinomycetemcomitans]
MPLTEDFLLRYPEFGKTDAKRIALFLSDAQAEVSKVQWGKLYDRGVMALTAHLLKLSADAEISGGAANRNLASESAGELSVSYTAPISANGSDDFYQLTAYGQEYLRLRRLIGVGVMVA